MRVGNSAMRGDLAIGVGPAFPRIDRREVRRLQLGDTPLQLGEIRYAREPDLAGAPGLRAGPLDRVVEILRLLGREEMRGAFRIPGAARVDDHYRVTARHPEGRVRRLEGGVFGDMLVA